MVTKVIKTEREYEAALRRVEELTREEVDPADCDEIELLATLIELYEKKHHPINLPDPVEAVKFRMEQAGLRQQDLVPYFGSRSKVSEVLSGKRSLSLSMIRSLHQHLAIPAAVLLRERGARLPEMPHGLQYERFPLNALVRFGWVDFAGTPAEAREHQEELVRAFLEPVCDLGVQPALLRQHVRAGSKMDEYALFAWRVRVLTVARSRSVERYRSGTLNEEFARRLVSLSCLTDGPRLAQEFLGRHGIYLVVVRHLPRTHLDGAAMLMPDGTPVVALTCRHDRLDNFWFTLMHELAHVALHLESRREDWFIDDLDAAGDNLEKQADRFASDMLISPTAWKAAEARKGRVEAVRELSRRLNIHPAIVAGRVRREVGNFKMLSNLVGQGAVRKHFPHAGFRVRQPG